MDKMLIGSHTVMRAIMAAVRQIAPTDSAVFISGERGTGKELLARALHAGSRRPSAPFVRIDCAELPPERLEGELLTASVPAFGRSHSTANLLDRARGGTLLLDHLPEMPLDLQARLPVLLAVGGGVRIFATGERDLVVEQASQRLSADLIEYLVPLELAVPALRERRSDIPRLVEHFLAAYGERHGVGPCQIRTDAMVLLWQYDWPGNVRQLESLVERIVVMSRGAVIGPADLPAQIVAGNGRGHAARPSTAPRSSGPSLRPLF